MSPTGQRQRLPLDRHIWRTEGFWHKSLEKAWRAKESGTICTTVRFHSSATVGPGLGITKAIHGFNWSHVLGYRGQGLAGLVSPRNGVELQEVEIKIWEGVGAQHQSGLILFNWQQLNGHTLLLPSVIDIKSTNQHSFQTSCLSYEGKTWHFCGIFFQTWESLTLFTCNAEAISHLKPTVGLV